ncbi:uncharacterized protein TNCV_2744521 [Trichonephila clavipes]|nr:uncharacterized protein TNCV_2744521 [Trichonephila clavipes]
MVSDHGRHVMSSSPESLKTRHVGERCTLNLSRAQTSSGWCGVVVKRGACQLRCRPLHLAMVQNDEFSTDLACISALHGGSLVLLHRNRDKASHDPIPIPLGYYCRAAPGRRSSEDLRILIHRLELFSSERLKGLE